MELPSEDSGPDMPAVADSDGGEDALLGLPPDDSGHDLLPEISGGEDMFKTPAKRARRTSGVAAGSRDPPPGDLQLPAEVVQDELDDMFDDVLSSPDKRIHKFVKVHQRKGMKMKKQVPGPQLSGGHETPVPV